MTTFLLIFLSFSKIFHDTFWSSSIIIVYYYYIYCSRLSTSHSLAKSVNFFSFCLKHSAYILYLIIAPLSYKWFIPINKIDLGNCLLSGIKFMQLFTNHGVTFDFSFCFGTINNNDCMGMVWTTAIPSLANCITIIWKTLLNICNKLMVNFKIYLKALQRNFFHPVLLIDDSSPSHPINNKPWKNE